MNIFLLNMNYILSFFLSFVVWITPSIQNCTPSNCESGCCQNEYSCLKIYQSSTFNNLNELGNCYAGDCKVMNCPSDIYMCCYDGKCYENSSLCSNNTKNQDVSKETTQPYEIVLIVLFFIFGAIFFCCSFCFGKNHNCRCFLKICDCIDCLDDKR